MKRTISRNFRSDRVTGYHGYHTDAYIYTPIHIHTKKLYIGKKFMVTLVTW